MNQAPASVPARSAERVAASTELSNRGLSYGERVGGATQGRRAKRNAQARLAQLAAIVESTGDAIIATDLQGSVTSWNHGAEQLYGWSASELIGQHVGALVSEAQAGELARIMDDVGRGETISACETTRFAKDGSPRSVSLTVSPIRAEGKVVGTASIARDVSDRKRAQEALRRSEARYRALLENLPDALVAYFDLDRRFVYAAGRLMEVARWTPGELTGRRITELLPPEPAEQLDSAFLSALDGHPRSLELRGSRNPELVVAYDVVPVHDEVGEIVGGMFLGIDVSSQRRSEAELRAARELFEGAFENAPVGMALVSAEPAEQGRFIRVNPAFAEMLGVQPAELVGALPAEVTHPDDLARSMPGLQRMLAGDLDEHTSQKRYLKSDGTVVHTVLRAKLVRGPDGAPRYALGVVADMTSSVESKQEQGRLEAMLHQAQKLESIGRLAGGIAHDFNNLLAVILNYAELGRQESFTDEALSEISWAGERAADLTKKLLVLSRQEVANPVVLSTNTLVAEMQKFLLRTIGEDIELSTEFDPRSPLVLGDKTQMEQTVINLAVNARDAMPEGGRMQIATQLVTLGEDDVRALPHMTPGEYVELRVTDTGCGMTEEVAERVFEPFFTTKEAGEGTGLGLAMVYGIATGAGGTALIDSAPDQGTTVRVLLPQAEQTTADDDSRRDAEPPPAENRTVLLVEDERAVRRLMERILSDHGYAVVTAAHPQEALELASSLPRIDLLLTDVVMPGMSGTRLAEKLRDARPEMRVLFTTGYTARPERLPEGADILSKPFTPNELLSRAGAQ